MLLPILSTKKSPNPGHCVRNRQTILKGREKADYLGISGPKKQHGGKFPGILFVSHIWGLGNGDAGSLEVPRRADQKRVSQSLFPLAKLPRKGNTTRETFHTITTIL